MIDVESAIFSEIATALRDAFDDIYVAGEYVAQPPRFPAVLLVEMDNTVYPSGRDSGGIENYADVMYQVDATLGFPGRSDGKEFSYNEGYLF